MTLPKAKQRRNRTTLYSEADFTAALERCITPGATAKELGISRATVWNYIKRWDLYDLIHRHYEDIADLAESKLVAAVQKGEGWAITWVLGTQAKKRGWTKQLEITGANNGPIQFEQIAEQLYRKLAIDVEPASEAGEASESHP